MALQVSREEMAELVPESKGWDDVRHWVTSMGTPSLLIAYAELFWPDFVQLDDCVVLGNYQGRNIQDWLRQLNGDRTAVEKVCNHVDLIYLFQDYTVTLTDAQTSYLGRLLREMWQAKLNLEFPDRRFAVEFFEDPGNPDDEPLVTFSQIRSA